MKNLIVFLSIALLVGTIYGCKHGESNENSSMNKEENSMQQDDMSDQKTSKDEPKQIEININAKSESDVSGTVQFKEKEGNVHMIANLSGLKPGKHAIHLHQKADCSAKDGKSSGGHWNPTNQPHGKWGDKEGYHRGDIGNFEADGEGNAMMNFETDEWCIDCGDSDKDIMGRAVIIHEGEDVFTSQPYGNAGNRVACAGIE